MEMRDAFVENARCELAEKTTRTLGASSFNFTELVSFDENDTNVVDVPFSVTWPVSSTQSDFRLNLAFANRLVLGGIPQLFLLFHQMSFFPN